MSTDNLFHAIDIGDTEAIKVLLANGADANATNTDGVSALMRASAQGNTDIVRLLLNNGANINYRDSTNESAIWVALREGKDTVFHLLLEHGVDPDERYESYTLLMVTAALGHDHFVHLLLDHKANVSLKADDGMTTLLFGIRSGNVSVVNRLLAAGAAVDAVLKIDEAYLSALTLAIIGEYGECSKIVDLLIQYGADPNGKDSDGFTPLYHALPGKRTDIVEALLSNGADPNISAPGKVTELEQAIIDDHVRMVYLLLNSGADTTVVNDDGFTPLAEAAIAGKADIVEMLLKHGADPNARRYLYASASYGSTVLMLAAEAGHADIAKILLKYNADPDIKDRVDNTALSIARHYGRSTVVSVLQGVTTGESPAKAIAHGIWGGLLKATRFIDSVSQGESLADTSKTNIVRRIETKVESGNSLQLCLDELNNLPGLHQVKAEVNQLINFLRLQEMRKQKGFASPDRSLHMVFTGNPGTGKTTVARLLAQIYKNLGVLNKGQFIETDRAGLVASYLGQTAPKVHELVRKSLGGLLFIDEAYTLAGSSHKADEFGQEAIDTLLKLMEDHRDNLVVIVAGYTEPMQNFIRSNPGLQSRFNNFLHFDDYATAELTEIFKRFAVQSDYKLHPATEAKLNDVFKQLYQTRDATFSNARLARNLYEKAVNNHASRMVSLTTLDDEGMVTLYPDDLPSI